MWILLRDHFWPRSTMATITARLITDPLYEDVDDRVLLVLRLYAVPLGRG